ncbi:hypothetical protein ESCO_004087 [Escovopsis weberi]|uniref:37S ribosomal protein rsm22 n=1 Tax=Escovopsis weberi TaxID=150374 RepID=A0A0M9VVH3_ESCWE|nr:hypothetical protein ESCO_004087 [Escovopsis weberi]
MSFDIWPPVTPTELESKAKQAQDRELEWIARRTIAACRELKLGLEGCYALLAPAEPGSTLVMSTPRNEKVKGTITRVGTRIVKGSLGLQLRMMPPQTLTLAPAHDIPVPALEDLHIRLTESIDLLALVLSHAEARAPDAHSLSSALRLLTDSIASAVALLKGPPVGDPLRDWTSESVAPTSFAPPLGPNLSFYIAVRECAVVLWLRVLEPVNAPVHLGTRLGLVIGTLRRLEHDEMDLVFRYKKNDDDDGGGGGGGGPFSSGASVYTLPPPRSSASTFSGFSGFSGFSNFSAAAPRGYENVYVREKVRVESADPNLISLHAKLGYLSIMLAQARRNLAAVMNAELEI